MQEKLKKSPLMEAYDKLSKKLSKIYQNENKLFVFNIEDFIQDKFLYLYQNNKQFENVKEVESYLRICIKNELYKLHKESEAKSFSSLSDESNNFYYIAGDDNEPIEISLTPEGILERAEQLAGFTEKELLVFQLKKQGIPNAEIAIKLFKGNVGNVHDYNSEIRKKVRKVKDKIFNF